jgi:2-methylisocitrate lyase-like PEP mutase family enzyme
MTDLEVTHREKAERFAALHAREGAFIIPNPWDAGSARLLTVLGGFEALATTSGGAAYALGKADGGMTRDEALANARLIVNASHLPVAADLENGYGDAPDQVAETIRLAGESAGLAGGSIEDATGDPRAPLYEFEHAVERIHAAAAEAAHALPFPFVLVARCENFLHGRPDLDDTIRRLQAFEAAGADALFAPGLTRADDIRTLCSAVGKPVNVLGGLAAPGERPLTVAELSALGVRRISVGSALMRAALGAFLSSVAELQRTGTFGFMQEAVPYARMQALMFEP